MDLVLNRRASRRTTVRSIAAGALLATSLFSSFGGVAAQDGVDPTFSNTILHALGLPEINPELSLAGIFDVPDSMAAGRQLVNYSSNDAVGYLLFRE